MGEWIVEVDIYVVSIIICGEGEHGAQSKDPPVSQSRQVVLSHDWNIQESESIVVAAILVIERRLRYIFECHAGHQRECCAEIAIQPVANACREPGVAPTVGFVDQLTFEEVDVVLPLLDLRVGSKYSCEQEHDKKSSFHCCYAIKCLVIS